jgi:Skp family chaperone for outer membrane proteins
MVTNDPASVREGMTGIGGMNVNRKILALAVGLSAVAIVGGAHFAFAQQKSSAGNIAVVDPQSLMQNSDAAKNARAQIEKARAELQQKAKGEDEALEKLRQSIAQQRPTLSAEGYEQLLRGLRQKISTHEIDMQERQDKLNRALLDASNKVAGAIVQIVDEIAKERNFAAVMSRAAVVSTTADITQEALKRLNQRMPSIALDLPK